MTSPVPADRPFRVVIRGMRPTTWGHFATRDEADREARRLREWQIDAQVRGPDEDPPEQTR